MVIQNSLAKKYSDSLIDFIEEYRHDHLGGPVNMNLVAAELIRDKRWSPQKRRLVKELARDLSKAANNDRHTDPQGRKGVRTYHAAKVERPNDNGQLIIEVVWDHINSMSLDHAQVSFEQRHGQIEGACKSLNNDKCSFNDNNPNAVGNEIQMSFDFTFLVEPQAEQVTEEIPPADNMELTKKKPH